MGDERPLLTREELPRVARDLGLGPLDRRGCVKVDTAQARLRDWLAAGFTYAEIADATGAPPSTLASLLSEKRKRVTARIAIAILTSTPAKNSQQQFVDASSAVHAVAEAASRGVSLRRIAECSNVPYRTVCELYDTRPPHASAEVVSRIQNAPLSALTPVTVNRVPVAVVRPHVQALLDAGHTTGTISRAAPRSIHPSTVYDVLKGRQQSISSDIAQLLLAMPIVSPSETDEVELTERVAVESVHRHVTTLRQQGMTLREIADDSGVPITVVGHVARSEYATVKREHADALLAVVFTPAPNQEVDAAKAVAHINWLRSLGASQASIARAAGVSLSTVGHLATGRAKTAYRASFEAILAVQAEDISSNIGATSPARAKQRLLLLLDKGHSYVTLAEITNLDRGALVKIANGSTLRIRKSTEEAILAVDVDVPPPPSTKVAATEVREHILALCRAGAIDRTIAEAAGVALSIVSKLRTGSQKVVMRHTAEWILSVSEEMAVVDAPTKTEVVQRHLQQFFDAGYSNTDVGEVAGLSETTIREVRSATRGTVRQETAASILRLSMSDFAEYSTSWGDVENVRGHVADLLDHGMSTHQIAQQAGVSLTLLRQVVSGSRSRVTRTAAARILTVQVATPVFVPPTGTRRRIQALVANGWTLTALQEALGVRLSAYVSTNGECRSLLATTATRVADFYVQNEDQDGGSQRARGLAVRNGWLSPAWWDVDTIDDPAFYPKQVPFEIGQARRKVVASMRDSGMPIGLIVETLSVPEPVIRNDINLITPAGAAAAEAEAHLAEGLTIKQTAEAMGVTAKTVRRYLASARSDENAGAEGVPRAS